MVETKKLSAKDTCGMGSCAKIKHCIITILLVLNTLLLIRVLCNQVSIEADRVGGRANYKLVQQIYDTPAFRAQQKQQIEQALQMYQQGWTQQAGAQQAGAQQGRLQQGSAQQAGVQQAGLQQQAGPQQQAGNPTVTQ